MLNLFHADQIDLPKLQMILAMPDHDPFILS